MNVNVRLMPRIVLGPAPCSVCRVRLWSDGRRWFDRAGRKHECSGIPGRGKWTGQPLCGAPMKRLPGERCGRRYGHPRGACRSEFAMQCQRDAHRGRAA